MAEDDVSLALMSPEACALLIRRISLENLPSLLKSLANLYPAWSDPMIVAVCERMKRLHDIPWDKVHVSDEGAYQARIFDCLETETTIDRAVQIHGRFQKQDDFIRGLRSFFSELLGEDGFSALSNMLFFGNEQYVNRFLITLFAHELYERLVERADAYVEKRLEECKKLVGNEKTKVALEVIRGISPEKASAIDLPTMMELLGAIEGCSAAMVQHRGVKNIRIFLKALVQNDPSKTEQDFLYSYELLYAVELQEQSDKAISYFQKLWESHVTEQGSVELDPFDVKSHVYMILPSDVYRMGSSLGAAIYKTIAMDFIAEVIKTIPSEKIRMYYQEERFWEYSGTYPTAATTIKDTNETIHELASHFQGAPATLLRKKLEEAFKNADLAHAFHHYLTQKPFEDDDALIKPLFQLIFRAIWTRLERESKGPKNR